MAERAASTTSPKGGRQGRRGPTVVDVARRAGVSPMTVSRVVNREENVLPATRAKVEKAIRALGYVPNQAARNLAGGRQCRIALLHSNPSASFLSEVLVGSLSEANSCDAQLIVEYCSEGETAAQLVGRLAHHQVDAVLLPPPLCEDGVLLDALRAADLPVAQIATGTPAGFADAVTIDDEAAAHALTMRLITLGHRRIGFILGSPNQTSSALRHAGFARALTEAGIACDPALVRQGDYTSRSGMTAALELLGLGHRPTAIFASNDDMAAAATTVAHRLGLDVPRDVSICGFDDTAVATTIWPELTTIRQPIAEMARRALHLLVDRTRRREDHPARHEQLAHTLIVRGSDAAPQAES